MKTDAPRPLAPRPDVVRVDGVLCEETTGRVLCISELAPDELQEELAFALTHRSPVPVLPPGYHKAPQ